MGNLCPAHGSFETGIPQGVAWSGQGSQRVRCARSTSPQLSPQAWLTEIQEYAQHNVVLMLLGNKVGSLPCPLQPMKQGR